MPNGVRISGYGRTGRSIRRRGESPRYSPSIGPYPRAPVGETGGPQGYQPKPGPYINPNRITSGGRRLPSRAGDSYAARRARHQQPVVLPGPGGADPARSFTSTATSTTTPTFQPWQQGLGEQYARLLEQFSQARPGPQDISYELEQARGRAQTTAGQFGFGPASGRQAALEAQLTAPIISAEAMSRRDAIQRWRQNMASAFFQATRPTGQKRQAQTVRRGGVTPANQPSVNTTFAPFL